MDLENLRDLRKIRSSRRLRYEAKADVFKKEKGDLEAIRSRLGLRPSQMCELLKVHPSAWTRWVKEKKTPPHVFQMLEWYLELLQWRGQNHPLKDTSIDLAKEVRLEDPQSYVPPQITIRNALSHYSMTTIVSFILLIQVLIALLISWGVLKFLVLNGS